MGRQLALAATPDDEVELLRFIDSVSPIRIYKTFAPSIDELWLPGCDTRGISGWQTFHIWPVAFGWEPRYGLTGGPGCPPERAGQYYVANGSAGPILELSRSLLEDRNYGRIYWARNFSAPRGLTYDEAAFSTLTDQVWRWIRKNGRRLPPDPAQVRPYFLPHAWNHYGAAQTSNGAPDADVRQ